MAIKVKHDVNAAPMAVASAAGGKARRSMETARLLQNQRTQALQGAHASPISPGQSHAPTLSAHAPTPVNWGMQRRENAAQEAARAAIADRNIAASKERAQMGIDADVAKLKSQQEFSAQQREAGQKFRSEEAQAAREFSAQQEEARRKARQEEWDRQHGILRRERDEDRIAAGTHEYGYSPEVQREYDRLQREYDEGLQSGRYLAGSEDERRFMDDMERKIAALPKTLVPRNDPEGMFKRNTFTDAQGRIFTTDGKLVYNPADAETRRMEFQQRQMDAEEKRYIDAVMKLQQGYRVSEPVYKMDELGEKPLTDENGNPIVEKWNSSYRPYTEDQQDAILRRLFPNRFANVQPEPAAQQPSPFQQALQNWLKDPLGTGAKPAAQPAPTAQQPTAQPTSQAQPVIRQDSQGVNWEVVFDENGKPIGKRRVRQ